MKNRNPVAVFLLPFVTFGIYAVIWEVKTKDEMNQLGADIPTAWLLLVPFVNIWWTWRYCQGVEKVTGGKTSAVLAFVLLALLGSVGMVVIQLAFNEVAQMPVGSAGNGPAPYAPPVGQAPQPVYAPVQAAPAAAPNYGNPVQPVPQQPPQPPSQPLVQ